LLNISLGTFLSLFLLRCLPAQGLPPAFEALPILPFSHPEGIAIAMPEEQAGATLSKSANSPLLNSARR